MREFAFVLMLLTTFLFVFGNPAFAAMLPLATRWRKIAWGIWLAVFLIGLASFWNSYFEKGFFQIGSVWAEKPLSQEAFALFAFNLAAPLIALVFWVVRRPQKISIITWRYRVLVLASAYFPVVTFFAINKLQRG